MAGSQGWNKQEWDERNRKVIDQFRASGGKVGTGKIPHLLLTTTGAKSELSRVNPLHYSTDGDRLIVVASKGGAASDPDWYHNLVAHPEVIVEVGAEQFRARASVAEGQERERLYNQHAALLPHFAGFQKRTKRQIPVIILERTGCLRPVRRRIPFAILLFFLPYGKPHQTPVEARCVLKRGNVLPTTITSLLPPKFEATATLNMPH